MKKKRNGGFSLVELIVVIAVMAILIGAAVPVYSQYIEKAQKAKDESYLESVAYAAQLFAAEKQLALSRIAIAPKVEDGRGIELYLEDGSHYDGSMAELYEIVGAYTFETLDKTNVTYFDHVAAPDNETAPNHVHVYGKVLQAKTCTQDGILGCTEEGCTATSVDPSAGHSYAGATPQLFGNMRIYTCVNEGCNYQIVTFVGESIG